MSAVFFHTIISIFILYHFLQDLANVPQDLSTLMRVSTANLMCNMILDRSFDYDNKEIHHLIHLIEQFLKVFSQTKVILVDYVPITRPFLGQAAKEVDVLRKELTACVMSKVTEHQRSFTSDSEFRGFLDFYLAKMAEEPDIFTLEDLRFVLVDLMIASIHTTSSTLTFALLYMALNPDVQKQVHDEAIKVCITIMKKVPKLWLVVSESN